MFNTGFRGKRASDGTGTINPQENFVQNKYPVPTITSWTISGSDDDALDPAGGQTVLVNGGGFFAGCAASVNGVTITPVTVISANQISFTSPALAGGSYTLIVYNSAGGGAILVPGLVYSSVPTYTTAQGSIGSGYETTDIDTSVVATSDSSITYTITSGALPSGASMTSGGVITGTYPTLAVGTSETFYFDITATDAEDQDVTRSFTLTTNIDVVTWVTPSSGATITLDGTSYSQALSATDAAGYSVSYAANALPTGLTLDSGTISGTPTVDSTTTTLLTATAATTNRSATNTITWVVSLSDVFWKNVTLLLNGSTPTTTFINDASLNNSQLTIAGDTKPNNFNPYAEGYYSVQFNGTVNDYVSIPTNTGLSIMSGSTNTFVAECWVRWNVVAAFQVIMDKSGRNGVSFQNWSIELDSSKQIKLIWGASGTPGTSAIGQLATTTIPVPGQWYHIAFVKSSADWSLFVNGVRGVTFNGLNTANDGNPAALRIGLGIDGEYNAGYMNGYISNVRVYNGPAGSAPYSATSTTITVPTAPATIAPYVYAIANQSNRYIDNALGVIITSGSGVKISGGQPFSTPTTSAYNTQYSTTFDGTGDYLTVANTFNLTGDFTIEFWVRYTSVGSGYQLAMGDGSHYIGLNNFLIELYNGTSSYFNNGGSPYMSAGNWYHIAICRASNTISIYFNGVKKTLSSGETNSGAVFNSGQLTVGGTTTMSSGQGITGLLSNVRIVNGVALYSSSFTPPTQPLTAVSGTSLLTCQDSTLKDNSTNNFAITSTADAKPVAVSPFTMTTSNTTVTSLGSAYFDGTGDGLLAPTSPAFAFGSGDFTMEFWYHPTSTSGTNPNIMCNNSGSGSFVSGQWSLHAPHSVAANKYTLWVASSSTSAPLLTSTSNIATNTWTHVAITRSGNTWKLFLNGIVEATATFSGILDNGTTNPQYIGYQPSVESGRYITGYINDLRMVKGTALYTSNFLPPQTPLTPVTNTQLLTCQYNGGANNNGFVDQSSFNNIITRNGNATQGTFSPFSQTGWSNYFDGTGDYLTVPNTGSVFSFGTGNFTVEAWVYLNAMPGGNGYPASFWITGGGPVNADVGFDIAIGSTNLQVGLANFTSLNINYAHGMTTNTWYHIAVERNTNTLSAYKNGTLLTSASVTGVTADPCLTGLAISAAEPSGATSGNFNGYISNVRIVKGTALYTATFTPSTTPLTAVSGTSLLTCQSNRLIDNSPNNFTITKNGDVSVQAFSPFGGVTSVPTSYSNYFDGTGDYLQTPTSVFGLGTTFTVEAWVYPTELVSDAIVFASTASGEFSLGYNGTTRFGVSARALSWLMDSTTLPTLNAWNHIVVSRGGLGTNQTSLFINGVRVATATIDRAFTTMSTWQVGYDNGGGGGLWKGNISNLRVVAGTDVYGYSNTSLTSPSAPLTAITNTQLLTCQSNTIVDNSLNNFTITAVGDVKPRPFNPFGTTTTTSVSYTPSVNGGSMYFDGTGDYLTIPYYPYFDIPANTPMTFECWVYTTSTNTFVMADRNWSYGGSGPTWAFFLNSGVTPSWGIAGTGSATYVMALSTISGLLGQWNHYAFTRDSSNVVRIFVNGILGVSRTDGQAMSSSSGAVYIASPTNNAVYSNGYMSGMNFVSGVALYTSNFVPAASPATPTTTIGNKTYASNLLLTGTSGVIIDYHGTNDLETVGNTQLAPEDPYSGSYYSNYFDGTGDVLSLANNSAFNFGSGDFTIECWFYISADSATNTDGNRVATLLTTLPASGTLTNDYSFTVSGNTTVTGTAVAFNARYNGTNQAVVYTESIPKGVWHHFAVTKTGNTATLYYDGAQVAQNTSFTNQVNSNGTGVKIGAANYGTYLQVLNGYISNFRLVKGSVLYTGSTYTVPTAPLTAVSSTSLLTCQSNKFKDNSTNNFTVTKSGDTKVKSFNPFQNNTGKSLYFNGSNTALLFNGATIPGGAGSAFTVEFWIYFPATTASVTILRANGNSSSFCLATNSSSQLVLSNVFAADFMATTTAFSAGVWNFVSITRSAANLYSVYFNGSSAGTPVTYATSIGILGMGQMYFAYNTYTTGYSSFYLKDFRVTNGVARNITVPTSPLRTN